MGVDDRQTGSDPRREGEVIWTIPTRAHRKGAKVARRIVLSCLSSSSEAAMKADAVRGEEVSYFSRS